MIRGSYRGPLCCSRYSSPAATGACLLRADIFLMPDQSPIPELRAVPAIFRRLAVWFIRHRAHRLARTVGDRSSPARMLWVNRTKSSPGSHSSRLRTD